MAYVDGFVAAVPKANKQAYIDHARQAAELFKEWGATRCVETWGDDVPPGQQTDFMKAVAAKPDEVIIFSWVEYPKLVTVEVDRLADLPVKINQDTSLPLVILLMVGETPN